ncbi:hypothetical protein FRC11_004988 [Ceratobasidium sp. 423]|nr:hypothetical protein FRC11_004988 [Ceratobasidium sp. 423]
MPPSRNARRGSISFRDIDPTDWEKLGQVFAIHGVRQPKFALSDGTDITTDECVQIATGEDFSETSAPNEQWFAEILDIKSDNKHASDRKDLPSAGCGLKGCGLRYAPDDEIQRFCPRWLCREWWHEECLRNREHARPFTAYSLLRMLRGTPGFLGADDAADDETPVDNADSLDTDEEFDLELASICSDTLDTLKDIEQNLIRFKDYQDKNLSVTNDILRNEDHFLAIEKILWCARSPIVRGKEYGIVGTGDLVTKARNILKYTAESSNWPSPDMLAPFASCELPVLPIMTCPNCHGAI